MLPLCVLLWGHFTVRRRRYVHTPFEMISTVLGVILLFLVRGVFYSLNEMNLNMSDILDEKKLSDEYPMEAISSPSMVYYTPVTRATRALMQLVGSKLGLTEIQHVPGDYDFSGIYGVQNDSRSLRKFSEKLENYDAFVIFENATNEPMEHLNYTIRMKSNFHKSQIDAGAYETFLRLQWAIDTSFIERRQGAPITTNITFHEVDAKDKKGSNIAAIAVVIFLILFSRVVLLIPFATLMTKYVEEKVSGHQELLKMNGVRIRTVFAGHLINMLPTGVFYAFVSTIFLKVSRTPLLPQTDLFIIAMCYFLNFCAMMHWALLCTFFVNTENYITAKSSLMNFALMIPNACVGAFGLPAWAKMIFACIIPFMPMDQFYFEVMAVEPKGKGIDFSNFRKAHWKEALPVVESIVCMVLQCLILLNIVLWLSRVRPGPYGVPEPCCTAIPFYDKLVKKREETVPVEQISVPRDPKYFENPPNQDVGIRICNVTKVFGKGTNRFQALTNVSFDIYHGEIMVLLGHNGAGKTTLLSIVTGMIPATTGKVYISGLDVDKSQSKVRQDMGYCTQYNTFISYLTIMEQVRFWSMLKGQSYKEAKKSSLLLLKELDINDKANQMAHQLSGGMKRRLQLACALAGGSTVLVLDEPTSGLDVETRRQLWDLLLTLRGTRTMVLTTHYMEEADALGDRVAALHQGILKCHATPMHLKKNIGSGFRLAIMTQGEPKEAEITSIVTSMVGGASLKDKTKIQVTYDLPASETAKFPQLFEVLEGRQNELGIESMGVSMPTLEEVFLSLCSNTDTDFADEHQMAGMHMADYKKNTGFALFQNQAIVLFKRHFFYMLENKWWSSIIWHVLLPAGLTFAMVYIEYIGLSGAKEQSGKSRRSSLQHRMKFPTFRRNMLEAAPYFPAEEEKPVVTVQASLADVRLTNISDKDDDILKKGKTQLIHKDNYLAGLLINSTHAKVMFKKGMYDVASIALNVLANTLAGGIFEGTRRAIQTSHQPITTAQAMPKIQKPIEIIDIRNVQTLMLILVAIYCVEISKAAAISSKERQTGARSIYFMSGCSVSVFWLVRLVFFLLFYSLAICLPLVITLLCFKSSRMMWTIGPIGVLAISFMCSCCAWLSFIFLLGLFASERIVTIVGLAITLVFGVFVPNIITTPVEPGGIMEIFVKFLTYLTYIITPATFSMAMITTSQVALANAYCKVNSHLCPFLIPMPAPFNYEKCCIDKKRVAEYFSFSSESPQGHIIAAVVQFVIFMIFLVLFDMGWFHNKCKCCYSQPPPQFSDPLVNAEKAYVQKTFAQPKQEITDVLLVNNLHKKFCAKSPAVRGVSFSVKQGECFGVLGVNGAGKTTTFRMIVGEIRSSAGTCFADKHFLNSERQAYLRSLSYCPQFLGLDTYMTGYQNLYTLLTIRGLKKQDIEKEINVCFDVVGLQQYKNKRVSEYSGGCMRRLAAGTALSSGAAVTLLDEPTCGVDVAARRRVWANIKQVLNQGRAVIITSHSMDEMETLSNRLMIMARGEVRLLGSPGALRASHAAGHAVLLKLAPTAHDDGGVGVRELKAEMNRLYKCTLKDEHQTTLRYHINETKKNSELFREMEKLKADFSHLVEDYAVSATSLEEVFLAIAQETSSQPPPKIKETKVTKDTKQATKGKTDQKAKK